MTNIQLAAEYRQQYDLLIKQAERLREKRKNALYLPGDALGRRIFVTEQMAEDCLCTAYRLENDAKRKETEHETKRH